RLLPAYNTQKRNQNPEQSVGCTQFGACFAFDYHNAALPTQDQTMPHDNTRASMAAQLTRATGLFSEGRRPLLYYPEVCTMTLARQQRSTTTGGDMKTAIILALLALSTSALAASQTGNDLSQGMTTANRMAQTPLFRGYVSG